LHAAKTPAWLARQTALAAGLLFLPLAASAAGVVMDCTEAALRAAAAGGGAVTFACDGTITLTNQIVITNDTVLDGTGHEITIGCTNPTPNLPGTGNRAFYVISNVAFTAINLSISNGCPQAADLNDTFALGGAILNDGILNLRGVSFLNNSAFHGGGAIANRNAGTVNASSCTFAGNFAGAVPPARRPAYGGAILNQGGQVSLQACVFRGNSAQAGYDQYGDGPSDAYGGAIHNQGSLNVSACTFQGNSVQGSGGFSMFQGPGAPGGPGGSGYGGAISSLGSLRISSSTIVSNTASGGGGGRGNSGEWDSLNYQVIPSGSGGNGGNGIGGGLYAGGTASAVNCTFCGNTGWGGYGGTGGAAWTGGFYYEGRYYEVSGPAGADGIAGYGVGSGCGGVNLTNCTLAFNMAALGTNWSPQWVEETLSGFGSAMVNSLVATTASGGNTSGPVVVAGSNLGSDVASLKLGPLAENGGPTLTMALLPGSPAIDAADPSVAPATDQRGFLRPFGSAADIGAYEFGSLGGLLAALSPGGGLDVSVNGRPGQVCWLLTSPDLVNWTAIVTNSLGPSGFLLFHDPAVAGQTQRFYRVLMP
jgi:hypothetical protein